MAPIAAIASEGFTLLPAVFATVVIVSAVLIGLFLCGCCGEKAEKGKNEPEPSPPESKERVRPIDKQYVRELAQRYRVTELRMQELVDSFQSIDADKDGSIGPFELMDAMNKFHQQPTTHEQAVKFIKQYDKDGDGCLQLEEYLTMAIRRGKWSRPEAEKEAMKAFKAFDKNKDGYISPAELCQAMNDIGDPISVEEAADIVKMADKNKDGGISYEEFMEFWKQYTLGGAVKDASKAASPPSQSPSRPGVGTTDPKSRQDVAFVRKLAQQYRVSEKEIENLVDRFRSFDKNNDGSLTADELVEAMKKMNQPITRDQAVKFIKQYDKNGDGCLQLGEFLTMVIRKRMWSKPDAEKAALKAFKAFDKDNDGHISTAEMCHAMRELGDPITVDEAADMIKLADKNKDGRIGYEEFVEFWKHYAVGN